MDPVDLQALNDQFAIENHVSFQAGPGGLPVAEIKNSYATATVVLQGAHVLAYQPANHRPVLWASRFSRFEPGQAIRGGIPVCWPWFGNHPTDADKPAHGFARTSPWTVLGTAVGLGNTTRLRLALADSQATRNLWPYPFRLELVVTVGPELVAELFTHNPGPAPLTYSGALHSYFSVSDVRRIRIYGLEGCPYIDKVAGGDKEVQAGPVKIAGETDRIYLYTTAKVQVEDPGWRRRLRLNSEGSQSTVVWNPWVEKARRLADFGDDEYTGMVCVETANAAADAVTVAPGATYRLAAIIGLEPDEEPEPDRR